MLYLVFFLTKSQNINETSIKTYSLKVFWPMKIAVRKNKYARKLRIRYQQEFSKLSQSIPKYIHHISN